jgi:hypothetical protein
MKASVLKKFITQTNPLIGDEIPVFECLILEPGKMFIERPLFRFTMHCDNKAYGQLDFKDVKKMVASLDVNDDIKFDGEMNSPKVDVILNREKIASLTNWVERGELLNNRFHQMNFESLGDIEYNDFPIVKRAFEYASTDELRPALNCLSIGKGAIATNGHLMTFEDFVYSAIIPISYLQRSSFERPNQDHVRHEVIDDKMVYYYSEKRSIAIHPAHLKPFLGLNNQGIDILVHDELKENPNKKVDSRFILKLVSGDYEMIFQMMDEKLPDYDCVIPSKTDNDHIILSGDRKELVKALKVANSFANTTTKQGAFLLVRKASLLNLKTLILEKNSQKNFFAQL